MKVRIVSLLFASILVLSVLLISISTPVDAQTVLPTPTPINLLPETTPAPNTNTIYLYQLGQNDIQLTGPYDVESLVFDLPAAWKLNQSATLDLDLTISLSVFTDTESTHLITGTGGNLTVEFNREVVGSLPLTQNGNTHVSLNIPLDLLKPIRSDGRQELVFVLDSGESCLINQQMTVILHRSSTLTFPHEMVLPDISLTRFPFPIYQNSIYPNSALIVIPDLPSPEELQSAMVLAAGLGRLTGLKLSLDMTSISKITPGQLKENNLILVGKASTLSLLNHLTLPLAVKAGKFQSPQGDENDGIIQMVHSPWSSANVVLVASGNTDAAVLKSAQALSTGVLRPNAVANISIIQEVNGNILNSSLGGDFTLLDLGYSNTLLQRRGVDLATYRFYVPPGQILSPDAYVELVYGNSALLNYGRSGLVVEVNDQPIGSVRFSDATAAQTMNRVQISIPASIVAAGGNKLDIVSSLQPVDNCSVPNLRGLWVNIWSDSRFHLPISPAPVRTTPIHDLANFPAPLISDSSLATTAFVLQRDDLESWRSALQVAAYLGDRSNGSISLLKTFYADAVPESARSTLNLVVIGLASHLSILSDLNNFLPAPFETGSGIATEHNMQVTYRIPADSPVGYVELLASPWNNQNVVIAVLGNLRQGVTWGASALYVSALRSRLVGNFAAINDQQVITTDTRLVPLSGIVATAEPGTLAVLTPATVVARPEVLGRPNWILTALVATLGLIVLILVWVFNHFSTRNRRRKVNVPASAPINKPPEKEEHEGE